MPLSWAPESCCHTSSLCDSALLVPGGPRISPSVFVCVCVCVCVCATDSHCRNLKSHAWSRLFSIGFQCRALYVRAFFVLLYNFVCFWNEYDFPVKVNCCVDWFVMPESRIPSCVYGYWWFSITVEASVVSWSPKRLKIIRLFLVSLLL